MKLEHTFTQPNMEQEADIRRILTTGYSLKHIRVKSLCAMAHNIENTFIDPAGKVDYKRFNAGMLAQWRGILDDIAREVGHRNNETRITGNGGGPIRITTTWGGGALED